MLRMNTHGFVGVTHSVAHILDERLLRKEIDIEGTISSEHGYDMHTYKTGIWNFKGEL